MKFLCIIALYFNFAETSPPLLCLYFNKVEILAKGQGVLRKQVNKKNIVFFIGLFSSKASLQLALLAKGNISKRK